jgi:hypothetical protein
MHLSYFKNSEFFPPVNHAFLSDLGKIDKKGKITILNLIDDAFVTWNRLKSRENRGYPNTSLRLREILAWRSLEQSYAESIAMNLNSIDEGLKRASHYMVSIRHPYETFENLIFKPNAIRIYLSYPITKTRINPEMTKNVDQFRSEMYDLASHEDIVIFDPVTIDELALQSAKNNGISNNDTIILIEKDRWRMNIANPLVKHPDYPIKIPTSEVDDSLLDIINNVKSRDYTLVESSHILTAFRPLYGGDSMGVRSEIEHAKYQAKLVCIYSPDEDNKFSAKHPFDQSIAVENNKDKFMQLINTSIQKRKNRNMTSRSNSVF